MKLFQRAGYEKIVGMGGVDIEGLDSKSVHEVHKSVHSLTLHFFSNSLKLL